jgi:hypothetical protein
VQAPDDTDGDGVANAEDACPAGYAVGSDTDGDGCKDDREDADDDGDGVADPGDACSAGATAWTSSAATDHDGDGCRDADEDADDDGDGVTDASDACPLGAATGADTDGDGCKDDGEDADDDGDGVPDTSEVVPDTAGPCLAQPGGCPLAGGATGTGDDGGGDGGAALSFGADAGVKLALRPARIKAHGPLRVSISNANAFVIRGNVTARTGKLRPGHRSVRLGSRKTSVEAGRTAKLRFRLPASVRHALKRHHRIRIVITGVFRDPAGHVRTVRLRATARRAGD